MLCASLINPTRMEPDFTQQKRRFLGTVDPVLLRGNLASLFDSVRHAPAPVPLDWAAGRSARRLHKRSQDTVSGKQFHEWFFPSHFRPVLRLFVRLLLNNSSSAVWLLFCCPRVGLLMIRNCGSTASIPLSWSFEPFLSFHPICHFSWTNSIHPPTYRFPFCCSRVDSSFRAYSWLASHLVVFITLLFFSIRYDPLFPFFKFMNGLPNHWSFWLKTPFHLNLVSISKTNLLDPKILNFVFFLLIKFFHFLHLSKT